MTDRKTVKVDNGPTVVNCPTCSRTIWAGSVCHHGKMPAPKDFEEEEAVDDGRNKGKDRRKKRDSEY